MAPPCLASLDCNDGFYSQNFDFRQPTFKSSKQPASNSKVIKCKNKVVLPVADNSPFHIFLTSLLKHTESPMLKEYLSIHQNKLLKIRLRELLQQNKKLINKDHRPGTILLDAKQHGAILRRARIMDKEWMCFVIPVGNLSSGLKDQLTDWLANSMKKPLTDEDFKDREDILQWISLIHETIPEKQMRLYFQKVSPRTTAVRVGAVCRVLSDSTDHEVTVYRQLRRQGATISYQKFQEKVFSCLLVHDELIYSSVKGSDTIRRLCEE